LEHLPAVEALSQYEAVKLFSDRARAAVTSFSVTNENAPAVAQICHRLDGIPLAIELAAAKTRVLGVEQIAKRLDDRFRLLTGGSRTALERHQTLRATIDWSYNLLAAGEQILFTRLSVFVGGWTLEAAESVCAGESLKSEDILDLLEHLITKSLVLMEEVQGRTRYSMLETLRQYANEKLVESGESDRIRDVHLEYFLSLAETAEPHLTRPEQLEWLAKLDTDYENLHSALEWALSKVSAEPSLRLCAALGWFWWIRYYWFEGMKWLNSALNKPSQLQKSEVVIRVKCLYQDALLANYLDDLEHMKRSAQQSLALAEEVSEKRDIAIARFYTGWALERQGEDKRALPLMEQSLEDFQESNDLYWKSIVYRWLGNILVRRGEIRLEERTIHHLELAREAGEKINLAEALLNYAFLLLRGNDLDRAREYAKEAENLFNQMGFHANELGFFSAQIAWLTGNYEEATSAFVEMYNRFEALSEKNLKTEIGADLGVLALEKGDLAQAHKYLQEALEVARELGMEDKIVDRTARLGCAFYLEGRVAKFKDCYRESLASAKNCYPVTKRSPLILVLDCIQSKNPENAARFLGALDNSEREMARPIHNLWKRYCDRTENYVRIVLGDETFESAFTEGQKLSLDEALDLALSVVEEM
jgi:tetratricopeptide (TPR) repeat protein